MLSVGNTIFLFFAPNVVKDNKDYGESYRAGKNLSHLEAYAKELGGSESLNVLIRDTYKEENKDTDQKSFWDVFNSGDKNRSYFLRLTVFVLYVFGLILVSVVFVKNVFWVFGS